MEGNRGMDITWGKKTGCYLKKRNKPTKEKKGHKMRDRWQEIMLSMQKLAKHQNKRWEPGMAKVKKKEVHFHNRNLLYPGSKQVYKWN